MAEPVIDPQIVQRVAELARLGLSEAELSAASAKLQGILAHFEALQAVDTEGVEPLVHAIETPGAPGDDEARDFPDPRHTLLPLTDHAREGFFVVPRVLDTEGGDAPAAG
ncbi:MAG: Asp-tRNA(Asn)/Glu-tRNA(Gln) amidotransferase subunit GatC [Planctomycetota bacterium]